MLTQIINTCVAPNALFWQNWLQMVNREYLKCTAGKTSVGEGLLYFLCSGTTAATLNSVHNPVIIPAVTGNELIFFFFKFVCFYYKEVMQQ